MTPVVRTCYGTHGAIAAGHPLGVGAGIRMLGGGGSAVDAAIAAQAVLCVVMPNACGLGGDTLALVHERGGHVTAVSGCGVAGRSATSADAVGGASVTVPGIVRAWEDLHARWGRLPLATVLRPAVEVAELGHRVGERLASAAQDQAELLARGGGGSWCDGFGDPKARVRHPALAAVLTSVAERGAGVFYEGALAVAIGDAVRRSGGALNEDDLAVHCSLVGDPIEIGWDGAPLWVQPPPSQGVLLALSLQWLDANASLARRKLDHVSVELTEAAFAFRDRAGEGAGLLGETVEVDPGRAGKRGGPRSYLHTTGVAVADSEGLVVSSLLSVFDDFGSGVFVPEGGFILNNRAGGFTNAPNDFAPGKRPVHTLAPMLLGRSEGPLAIATPGADGQVQTLLQVTGGLRFCGRKLGQAIAAPRWRSEAGRLLVERGHTAIAVLARLGHDVLVVDDGDGRMGAVVSAGVADDVPVAAGDWRREATAGAV